MLAVAAIMLGACLGLASGGDLRRLTRVGLQKERAIVILFLLQSVARGFLVGRWHTAGLVLWGAVSIALLCILAGQARTPGLGVAVAGVAANALVVLLNGGMPAGGSSYFTADALAHSIESSGGFYQPLGELTRLGWLGDVLPMAGGLASLGDLLLAVGIATFLLHAMLNSHPVE